MIRRIVRVPLFRSGSQKPGLVDFEHPDLTDRATITELQKNALQGKKSITFDILSNPDL